MREDLLGLLLPDARADEKSDVRRMITALRLLREDARGRAGRRAAPSWHRARKELESLERRHCMRALDGLLHAHLSALRPSESFLDLGPRALAYHEACLSLLQTANPSGAVLPPAPEEAPVDAVRRLLSAGEANGASRAWRAWWGACARHVTGPPAEAERGWEALLRSALDARAQRPFLARVLAGLVAVRLDRFQPVRAWALHERHAELAVADRSLRLLFGWTALFCGEEVAARRLLQAAAAARLPTPLLELRADRPELAALLPGARAESGPRVAPLPRLDRSTLGAILVGVFARGDRRTEILALDAPAEMRAAIARRCQGGWVPPGLLVAGDLFRSRSAHGEGCLPDSLAGADSRAQVTVAIRPGSGELAGWIRLESAHQLLPSSTSCADLARAWSETVLAAGGSTTVRAVPGSESPLRSEPFSPDDPRSEFAQRLFAGLTSAGGVRMVWIEPGPEGRACVRAERGMTLADRSRRLAGAAIVRRAWAERELACHRGELHEALHPGAARGFALPLLDARGERVLGVLVLESARPEALPDRMLATALASLRTLEPLWWSASFRASCRARDGRDLAWELSGHFLASLAPALQAAAESRAPLLLVGPRGAGRRTLARWLHFRGSPPSATGCEGGALVVEPRVLELTDLAPDAQRELARAAEVSQRFFLAAAAPAHVLRERGLLAPVLERVIDPLPLFVPPLCERRDEIPALARVLADNVARERSLRPTGFDDGALAALWRQDWRGNVSELAALVAQLARTASGRELGAQDVRTALHSRGLGFRSRLPSLRPSGLDLELALATTLHRGGSENLARAARYLGWDPDTLRARLGERDAPGSRRPSGE